MSQPPITQEQALAQSFAPEEALSLAPIQPAKPKRKSLKKKEKNFVHALTIRAESGQNFRVPINQESAKAERQLLAAKLMKAYSSNVDFLLSSNLVLEPKALSDFMRAGETISSMVEAAHKGEPVEDVKGGTSAIGHLAGQMLGAAAKGLMEGAGMSLQERMDRISQLGKKTQDKIKESDGRIRAQAAEVIVEPDAP